MIIIIFTCKLIIDNNININFDWIKGYKNGKYLYLGITKYISLWRISANILIYFNIILHMNFNFTPRKDLNFYY